MKLLAAWTGVGALLLLAGPAHAKKELVVDWERAVIYPLDDGRLVRRPIITNNRETFTWKDIGTFRISEKVEDKRSNLYNVHGKPIEEGDEGARMRFWMRLGWTAQGFHHSALFDPEGPRHRSHGCYRLSRKSARWLFDWAPVGTPVHVVRAVRASRFAYLVEAASRPTVANAPRRPMTRVAGYTSRPARAPSATSKMSARRRPVVTIRPATSARPARSLVRIRPAPRGTS